MYFELGLDPNSQKIHKNTHIFYFLSNLLYEKHSVTTRIVK